MLEIPKKVKDEMTSDHSDNTDKAAQKMRRIVIETDGNSIHLLENESSGNLELIAILTQLAAYLSKPRT